MRDDPARRVASELDRRGLTEPARLLLDAHRPLAPLLADLGAAIGPLLGALGGPRAASLGTLLASEHGLDDLVERLDEAEGLHARPG